MAGLTEPKPLEDVIASFDAKTLIGSALRTAEWDRMPAALRQRALFSASVTSIHFLKEAQRGVRNMVTRAKSTNEQGESYWTTDRSKLVADLRRLGTELGIPHPEGRKNGAIRESDLKDPLSMRRLKLIVNTQMEMAYGYGDFLAAHDPAVIDVWPCQELVRISPRRVPRDWQKRWSEAGGKLYEGRMIARKDSPIWRAISRFNLPYAPFDFESGMGLEDVGHDEAVQLGVMQDGDRVVSQIQPFNQDLEASVKNLTPQEKGWLQKSFGKQIDIEGNTVRWADTDAVPRPVPPAPTPTPPPNPTPAPEPQPASSSTTRPNGIAVSRAVIPAKTLTRKNRALVDDALKTVDSVHGDGALAPIASSSKVSPRAHGTYWGTMLGVNKALGDGRYQFTWSHETGHWIDQRAIEPGHARYSSESAHLPDSPMHAWWQAVTKSQAYALLQVRPPGKYRNYQLKPLEMWARSYAQFIAVEAGHAGMLQALDDVRTGKDSGFWAESQWSDADFEPIRNAMRDMFVKLGWMTPASTP